ncbi:MAG: 1,4-alpha-glucan branching protein domain-containing protein [Candidatus Cryosericum sp.]
MRSRFVLVLHSHLPYVLGKGRWPFGEEWLHEIVLDTYLPLLEGLEGLARDSVPAAVGVGITPILMEQLKSPDFVTSFRKWADGKRVALKEDISRLPDTAEARELNKSYRGELEQRLSQFDALGGDIVGAFASLQDRGYLEILTSCATHGYMPLFNNDESRRLQIRTGVATYQHWIGHKPQGFWLPECGYIPGVERLLSNEGLRYFVADAAAFDTGSRRSYEGAHLPVMVTTEAAWTPWDIGSGVAVFLRNPATSEQVWSRDLGYPGDGVYREFHRRCEGSGWQYWRITSKQTDLGRKELYRPSEARVRTKEHAAHFASLLQGMARAHQRTGGEPGVIVAAFDTELFGHWWYEGPTWISDMFRSVADQPSVIASAPLDVLDSCTLPAGKLRESSWGAGGGHDTWMNSETSWIWDNIHADQRRFIELLPELHGHTADVLLREILLEESSDWPFLITTGQAHTYGITRFLEHHQKVQSLFDAVDRSDQLVSDRTGADDPVFEHIRLDDVRRI